jgi:hypothetical protein
VTIATSIAGDQAGFVSANLMVVLPRNRDEVLPAKDLSVILGWYLAVARDADGTTSPAYARGVVS